MKRRQPVASSTGNKTIIPRTEREAKREQKEKKIEEEEEILNTISNKEIFTANFCYSRLHSCTWLFLCYFMYVNQQEEKNVNNNMYSPVVPVTSNYNVTWTHVTAFNIHLMYIEIVIRKEM